MYDVKQADPAEWTSPPWVAALVDKPGLGQAVVGRGAVNQKGPEAAFIAALHAIRGAGRKPPVNFVLVAEGEEEIGSPHFPQIVRRPEVLSALGRSLGIFMPAAAQGLDGQVTITLGAKGVVECELVSSGEKWGRGPRQDIHSSNKARVDSPAWHLVQALVTLVSPDGNEPAIEGYTDKARPISPAEKAMVAEAARRLDETAAKKQLGVEHWVRDVSWPEALERLVSRPTVNIEGLVGGYTGPGGKTILPHRAVAKLDPILLPRNAGSWPGYVFTGDPLRLPAGHFGLGHGSGAHAPDEYYLIESTTPNVQGFDGAVRSYVEYLYEVAGTR